MCRKLLEQIENVLSECQVGTSMQEYCKLLSDVGGLFVEGKLFIMKNALETTAFLVCRKSVLFC